MLKLNYFPVRLLWASAVCLVCAGMAPLAAQQPTADADRPSYDAVKEIHVDQDCRILPNPALQQPGKKKPKPHRNDVVCHLESIDSSEHEEQTVLGNQVHRSNVRITEQQYVLQNIRTEPMWFVVEQFLPEGWVVDSDPQPREIVGSKAIFRVHADPGEIVRLHVGLRRTTPLRTKVLKDGEQP